MQNPTNKIKINIGILRGLNIQLPIINTTRPSKSILRDSFVNSVYFDASGTTFVEAFAGSGSVGLNMISLGANPVIFCENNLTAFRVLENNLKNAKEHIRKNSENCIEMRAKFGDFFSSFDEIFSSILGLKRLILYIDPPFDIRENNVDIYQRCFDLVIKNISNFRNMDYFLLTFEHNSAFSMPKCIEDLVLYKQKRFGHSALTYYKFI